MEIYFGVKLNNFAIKKGKQSDRSFGLIYYTENVEVWIKKWNQVIQDGKGKYQHLKDQLEYGVQNNNEGLSYLRE
ncbi:hypothetical protein IQ283_05385 [Alkalihalobacillus hwajinpoensis]|uniref:hypothetical protein n=1 Tax=Guptibacillus hwajinpoensis TaxID=208199 RepID=UPI001883654F|nr:hypothetical protein [Pseudalkalibacillus hwajinpoensis]MBF0706034.1 hypothetical protein [Pseudalkalibacillus hwajinpoensis]